MPIGMAAVGMAAVGMAVVGIATVGMPSEVDWLVMSELGARIPEALELCCG